MILYVVRYFPAYSETFVAREIEAVRATGREVAVLSLGRRRDPVTLPVPPGTWLAPRFAGLPAWLWYPALRRLPWKRALAAGAAVTRGGRVAHVHAHFAGEAAEVARAVARVLGRPWSVTVHAADLFVPRPGLAALLRDATTVVTVAAFHQRWLADRYGVAAAVVRCGVDPAFLDVSPRAPERPLRVVCVARDVPKKGIDRLRAAVEADPRFALRVVSDAAPSDIPAILADSHVFALAARVADDGDRDGVPVALLEAMAAGLPVITTAVAGIPEVVDDRVGWLVPPDDPAALRLALEAALDDGERRRRGAAARARARTVADQARDLLAAIGA